MRSLPRALGSYLLLEELAKGGMARVFRAQRRPDGRMCAMKVLLERHAEKPAIVRRFEREAAVTSLLDHPNVARVLDAGFDDGSVWIAMELVEGQTIAAVIKGALARGAAIPIEITAAVLIAMLEGLAYVHAVRGPRGEPLELVHRDLSPRNVMITYDGEVKIIDFGVARAELGDFKTRPGQLLGSLRYLAPEQAMGMPVDRRSDLYTLGVIAYELLTLRAYVKNDHPLRVLRAIVQAPSRPDSDFEGVPAGVRAVVRRALSKRSEERFPSAEAMLDALRAELGEIVPAPAGDVSAYLRMLLPRAGEEERTVVAREEAESSPAFEPTRSTLRSLARDTLVRVVVHPARSLVPVAAVAVAIAAGLVAFTLTRAAPVEAPAAAPVQPATPLAKARKVEEPSKEPEGPPPVPKITEPPSRKPRAQKAPDQPPEPRYAALRKTVEALRDDPRRFEAAYDAIRAAAESAALPEATRASILATLNAARLAGDPAGLMRAIDELEE